MRRTLSFLFFLQAIVCRSQLDFNVYDSVKVFQLYDVTVADFNNDGLQDFATVHTSNNPAPFAFGFDVYLGNGKGGFQNFYQKFVEGYQIVSITTSDFNGDNNTDIIISGYYSESKSIYIHLGDGKGRFDSSLKVPVGSNWPFKVRGGDLNNDNITDIIVTGGDSKSINTLLGTGKGNFADPVSYKVGNYPSYINLGDLNNDNFNDVITINSKSKDISVLLNNLTDKFKDALRISVESIPQSLNLMDLNNDKNVDLVMGDSKAIYFLLGDGKGNFSLKDSINDVVGGFNIICDLNNDHISDILTISKGKTKTKSIRGFNSEATILIGNKNGSFKKENLKIVPWGFMKVADFNGDGKEDIFIISYGYGKVYFNI